MQAERAYYVALSQAPGIGLGRFKILLENFKFAKKVWEEDEKLLSEILGPKTFEKFNRYRTSVIPEKLLSNIEEKGTQVVTLTDKNYPSRLKEIFDPPAVLYIKGVFKPEDDKALGVVGTRKITSYGMEVTQLLVRDLIAAGLTIVSGLARGVDSLAHKTALENGGRTIAVLGSGVNVIYPPENTTLAKEIIKNGAVISELLPNIEPSRGYFPARNRIISGLSLGVLITEAGQESGSLITASAALEQNREVFAVPGPIYSKLSAGPTQLIKQGAKLVSSADDIFDELHLEKTFVKETKKKIKGETKEEQAILNCLENETKQVDQLIRETSLPADRVAGILLNMEIKGLVRNLGSGNYSLVN